MPVYTYSTFDVPLAVDTKPLGINDSGQIVGQYRDSSGGVQSFLFSNGTFTPINDPSATDTTLANGINNSGQIVGDYDPNNFDVPGFLFDPTSNVFPPTSPCMIPRPTKAPFQAASTMHARSSAITSTPQATTDFY
jgi:probable HAF family extracellular repeat protein